ncbi:MAG: PAS domain S-box protein [Candidatus Dactylopiibacterium sp.]|nr:PAS domain S-box protein [Candidatus Dactylopiibacterium sp.]
MPFTWIQPLLENRPGQDVRPLLHRLRQSVLAFYALFLLITVLVVSALSYNDYAETIASAQRQAFSIARSLDEHATRSIVSVAQLLDSIAEEIEQNDSRATDDRALHERLALKTELSPQIRALSVIGANGMLRVTGLRYPAGILDLSDRQYFVHHRDSASDQPFVGAPMIARLDKRWLIPVSTRLVGPGGRFDGVLLAALDPGYFLHFYDSMRLDRGTHIEVLREDGVLLVNYPFDIGDLGQNLLAADRLRNDNPIFTQQTDRSGGRLVAQLASQGPVSLFMRVSLDRERVLVRFHNATLVRVSVALLILCALSLMLGVLLFQIRRLERSEASLRLTQFAVNESPEMVVWCSPEGHIRYVNRRFAHVSGYAPDILLGMNLAELLDIGDVLGISGPTPQDVRLNGRSSRLRSRPGRLTPVELSAAMINDAADTYLCITARDVSEREAAQQELRRHRDHLQEMVAERTAEIRAVLDANPLAILLSEENRIVLVNPAFETLFGHDRNALHLLPEQNLYASPQAFTQQREQILHSLLRGDTYRGEAELRRRDGSAFWAVLFARSLVPQLPDRGIVFIIEDVSAQRAAALQLRQSEQLKRSVLEAMEESFVLLDAERRIVDVNRALCQQLGRSRETLLGHTPEAVWGEGLSARLFPPPGAMHAGAQDEILLPVGIDGLRPFQASDGVVADEHGRVAYRFAFLTDISRQKEIARSLREAKEAAEAANQAKTTFLTNMSHELRTPMHAILSFSEMGLTKSVARSPTDLARYFERIQGAGRRLLALLNDLLDLSRLEADRMRYEKHANSLQQTVQAALGEVSSLTARHRLDIDVDSASPRITARYDRARITQVLINLLSNAIKFSPEGGRIQVRFLADARLADGRAAVGFTVEDEGPGVAPADLEAIFESFRQSGQPNTGGSGLGLAISRRIMEDHGGRIHAANRPEGGALFTVLLPAEPPASPERRDQA